MSLRCIESARGRTVSGRGLDLPWERRWEELWFATV